VRCAGRSVICGAVSCLRALWGARIAGEQPFLAS
jgi:hypothetical protein